MRKLLTAALSSLMVWTSLLVPLTPSFAADTCAKNEIGHSKVVAGQTYLCRGKVNAPSVWEAVTRPGQSSGPGQNSASGSKGNQSKGEAPMAPGPKCMTTTPFSVVPIDVSITEFSPLGNINPPGHITPSTHGGLSVPMKDAPAGAVFTINGKVPLAVPVHLPAAIQSKVSVKRTSVTYSNGSKLDDYGIQYNVCGTIFVNIGHIVGLPAALLSALKSQFPHPECQNIKNLDARSKVSSQISLCFFPNVLYKAPAGVVIGTSGPAAGVDFGAWDTAKPLPLASFGIYPTEGESQYAICALELFAPKIRATIPAPKGCGSAALDKIGTASGAWFEPGNSQAIYQQRVIVFAPLSWFPGDFSFTSGALVPSFIDKNVVYKIDTDPASIASGKLVCIKARPMQGAKAMIDINIGVQVSKKGATEQLKLSDCQGKGAVLFERTTHLGPE